MGILMIKISVIYLLIGMVLGMYMSIAFDFAMSSVHSHVSLLGWTTMTLAGILYNTFPVMMQSVLCKIQFYLFNIGLPIMLISMALIVVGTDGMVPVVSTGASLVSLGILLFTINVFTSLKNDRINPIFVGKTAFHSIP